MPVITRAELEDAQRDAEDLGSIVNGAANLPNPGQDDGTVTTRLGAIVRTLSKLVADGQETVTARLTPAVYATTLERTDALSAVTAGQTGFDKEDTNLYIAVPTEEDPEVLEWLQVSNLQLAAAADLADVLRQQSTVGRITVTQYTELRDRDYLYERDAWLNHHIEVPGKTGTVNEGLSKVFGFTAWPTTHMLQEGVGFGLDDSTARVAIDDPTLGYEDQDSSRIFLRNDNSGLVENYNFTVGMHIDIGSGFYKTATIRNCLIDTNYTKLQCITKNNLPDYPAYVERCKLRRFTSEALSLNGGHLVGCDIELSQGDGLKAGGEGVIYHKNLVRLLGYNLPSAHADALQVLAVSDFEVTQNTFYMPGTGTYWDENTYGTTQIIRLITENNAHEIRDVYVAGNVFIGGGFSVAVRSRFAGSVVENVAIVNNIIGGTQDGNPYWVYGPITQEHWIGNNPGAIRNLILWGNIMHDGTSFAAETPGVPQGGTDQNGLWHYDKDYASPKFLEVGKKLGLLDWNGDPAPGVTNRTTG